MSHIFNFTDFRKNLLNAYPCVEAILETKGDGQLQELFPIRHDAHVFKLLKDDLRIPYIDEVIQSVKGKIEIFHDLLNAIGTLVTGQDDLGTEIVRSTMSELRDGFPDTVELPEFLHVRFVHCLKVKPRSLTVKVETVCGSFLRIFSDLSYIEEDRKGFQKSVNRFHGTMVRRYSQYSQYSMEQILSSIFSEPYSLQVATRVFLDRYQALKVQQLRYEGYDIRFYDSNSGATETENELVIQESFEERAYREVREMKRKIATLTAGNPGQVLVEYVALHEALIHMKKIMNTRNLNTIVTAQ